MSKQYIMLEMATKQARVVEGQSAQAVFESGTTPEAFKQATKLVTSTETNTIKGETQ